MTVSPALQPQVPPQMYARIPLVSRRQIFSATLIEMNSLAHYESYNAIINEMGKYLPAGFNAGYFIMMVSADHDGWEVIQLSAENFASVKAVCDDLGFYPVVRFMDADQYGLPVIPLLI
jgi:hypothetical protein